jgi:hypothetical protein
MDTKEFELLAERLNAVPKNSEIETYQALLPIALNSIGWKPRKRSIIDRFKRRTVFVKEDESCTLIVHREHWRRVGWKEKMTDRVRVIRKEQSIVPFLLFLKTVTIFSLARYDESTEKVTHIWLDCAGDVGPIVF